MIDLSREQLVSLNEVPKLLPPRPIGKRLPQRLFSNVSGDVKVVVLKGTHWETMPALYHCSILPIVQANIAKGQHALWKIIEQVSHQAIKWPPDRVVLSQINALDDLGRARSIKWL